MVSSLTSLLTFIILIRLIATGLTYYSNLLLIIGVIYI